MIDRQGGTRTSCGYKCKAVPHAHTISFHFISVSLLHNALPLPGSPLQGNHESALKDKKKERKRKERRGSFTDRIFAATAGGAADYSQSLANGGHRSFELPRTPSQAKPRKNKNTIKSVKKRKGKEAARDHKPRGYPFEH